MNGKVAATRRGGCFSLFGVWCRGCVDWTLQVAPQLRFAFLHLLLAMAAWGCCFVEGIDLGKKLMPVRLSWGFQIASRLFVANSGMKGHVMVRRMIFGVLLLLVGVISTSAEDKTTERQLPKVLLIGDSIMGGYFKPTSARLKEEAVVTRIGGQGGHTGTGLEKLDSWLGDTKWDVIHFNWGLHDIAYHPPGMKRVEDKVKGKVTTSLEDYERNLDKLVIRLKKTGAKLIWASTTVVPEGDPGRFVGDD